MPAWPDAEAAVQVTAPAPRYSDDVTAPLVPGVRVGRKPDEAMLPLHDAAVEGVTWQLKLRLVGLLVVAAPQERPAATESQMRRPRMANQRRKDQLAGTLRGHATSCEVTA